MWLLLFSKLDGEWAITMSSCALIMDGGMAYNRHWLRMYSDGGLLDVTPKFVKSLDACIEPILCHMVGTAVVVAHLRQLLPHPFV